MFSTKKKNRLKNDDVSEEIEKSYILQLKDFNLKDDTIPSEIWDKYQEE